MLLVTKMARHCMFVGGKSRWQFDPHCHWITKVHSSRYLWSHDSPENM